MKISVCLFGFSFAFFSMLALGQTQFDLATDRCNEYKEAESRLAAAYEKALDFNKDDKNLVDALKKSQEAWQAYVKAELSAIYPDDYQGGSAETMCRCAEQAEMINARIEQLSRWVYVQQGDVCTGSRLSRLW